MKLFKQLDGPGKGKVVCIIVDGSTMVVENCRSKLRFEISSMMFNTHYKEIDITTHAKEQMECKRKKKKQTKSSTK